MMRLRSLAVPLLALGLAGALFIPAAAHPRGRGQRLQRVADELNLTVAQREQIRQIVREHRQGELGEAMQAMRAAREAVRDLIHNPQATEDQIRATVRAGSVPAEELALARHRLALEIQQVLTAEQRERAREIGLPIGGPGMDGDGPGFGPPEDEE